MASGSFSPPHEPMIPFGTTAGGAAASVAATATIEDAIMNSNDNDSGMSSLIMDGTGRQP